MSRLGVVLCGGLALLGACHNRPVDEEDAPGEQAEAECGLLFGCSCDVFNYPDQASCEQVRFGFYAASYQLARQSGLVYDGHCVRQYLDALEKQGCHPAPSEPPPPDEPVECTQPCAVYHGSSKAGEPCAVDFSGFSSCAQGLVCAGDTCSDPCGAALGLGQGEPCRDPSNGLILGTCKAGLYCDSTGSNTCAPLPGEGAPCPGGQCAEGLVCQTIITDSTCVALGGPGDTCNDPDECRADLACDGGQCVEIPGEGQPCMSVCAEGLWCSAGTCLALPASGAPCPEGVCDAGLLCVEGTCGAGPGNGQPCYMGQCAAEFFCGGAGTCEPLPAQICSAGW